MRFGFRAFILLLALSGAIPAGAAEVLTYLPQNALGFALVRNAQNANEKIAKFVGTFEQGLPGPLDIALVVTGLASGLDVEGDGLFALLPGAEAAALPAPMILLPVTDYTVFANSIIADTSGDICRVTIAKEDVLVAKQGEFALLMNVEHRALMQRLLDSENVMPPAVAAIQPWIADNDVQILVTSAGMEYLEHMADEQRKASQRTAGMNPFSQPTLTTRMLKLGTSLPLAQLFKREVELVGLGVAIDDATNARFRWTIELNQPRAAGAVSQPIEQPLLGFPDEAYALAANVILPAELGSILPDFFTSLSRETAVQDGREDFTDDDWADVRKTYQLWIEGVKGVSLLLTPGKEGEPMLSIFFARLTVVDSGSYLEALRELFALSNELDARTKSDIKLNFRVSPVTIADARGIEATCDFDLATGDGNNIPWQALLTSLLGVDHKLSLYFCATDEHQVFFAMESREKLSAFIESYRSRDTGLASSAPVKATVELLRSESPWLGLANPQGFVELVRTAMKSVQILGFVPEFPPYPPAPPLGVTIEPQQTSWRGELVIPVEAARAMAKFNQQLEAAFR